MTVTRSVRRRVAWPHGMGPLSSGLVARGFMTSRWACEAGSGNSCWQRHIPTPPDQDRAGRCAGAPVLLRNGPARVYRASAREDTAGVHILSSQGEV